MADRKIAQFGAVTAAQARSGMVVPVVNPDAAGLAGGNLKMTLEELRRWTGGSAAGAEIVTLAQAAMDAAIAAQGEAEASASRVDLGALDDAVEQSVANAAAAAGYEVAASASADRAEAARDAATVNADVFASTSAGLAATSVGGQFQVAAGDEIIRYRHDAGPVAVEVARMVSQQGVASIEQRLASLAGSGVLIDPLHRAPKVSWNVTDNVAASFTRTPVSGATRIAPPASINANGKTYTHQTGIRIGGYRTRIRHRAKAVSVQANNPTEGVGIAISDGLTSVQLRVHAGSSSTIQMQVDGAAAQVVNAGADTYGNGASVDTVFDILHRTGEVLVGRSINGGPRYWTSFEGLPTGPLDLLLCQRNYTSYEHSLEIEVVPEIVAPLALPSTLSPFGKLLERRPPPGWTPAVPLPDDFRVYHYDGRFATSYDDLRSPLTESDHCAVIHVAPGGSDSAEGSREAPFASLRQALDAAKSVSRALIRPAPGDYDSRDTAFRNPSWLLTKSRVIAIVPTGAGRVLSSPRCTGLTWMSEGDSTWSAALTIETAGSADAWDEANKDADGDTIPMTLVGSVAAVKAAAGSYYVTGSAIYVRTFDNRQPDADLRVYDRFRGGLSYSVPGGSIYVERVDLEGVSFGFRSNQEAPYTGKTSFVMRDVGCRNARISNVLQYGSGQSVVVGALFRRSGGDSMSYGSFPAQGGTPMTAIEVDVVSRTAGAGSADQASTTHNGATCARVNCDYRANAGAGIADVNNAWTWMLGCAAKGGTLAPRAFQVGNGAADTSHLWLDTCRAVDTAVAAYTTAAAHILTHALDAGGGTTEGNVAVYVP